MPQAAIISVTLVVNVWSLWARRGTWRSYWDSGATWAIAFLTVAAVLDSPARRHVIGSRIYTITGQWHLLGWLGHVCCLLAAAALVVHVWVRLLDAAGIRLLMARIAPVLTAAPPLMLAAIVTSPATSKRHGVSSELIAVPVDGWLTAYWVVFCTAMAYLLGLAVWGLTILRHVPESRMHAEVWLAGLTLAGAAAGVRILTLPSLGGLDPHTVALTVWGLTCAAAITLSWSGGTSWRQRARWFAGPHEPSPSPSPIDR
ncbi:membrane protein [Mycobacterium phage Aminay]|uniref:Membrane protein n=1 Tax=Mycobacterium phage Aminay TaxID=2250291 RepID=A0A345KV31_9CAUD|nr:membrane protein [Mycobacterium phage Aminay]AXH46883.1 membrane protein [Mycobacterium phage Aminay]